MLSVVPKGVLMVSDAQRKGLCFKHGFCDMVRGQNAIITAGIDKNSRTDPLVLQKENRGIILDFKRCVLSVSHRIKIRRDVSIIRQWLASVRT